MELHKLDCLSEHRILTLQFSPDFLKEHPPNNPPNGLLMGDDLLLSRFRPGPNFTRNVATIEDAHSKESLEAEEAWNSSENDAFQPRFQFEGSVSISPMRHSFFVRREKA